MLTNPDMDSNNQISWYRQSVDQYNSISKYEKSIIHQPPLNNYHSSIICIAAVGDFVPVM
jgi:hypothetical protein